MDPWDDTPENSRKKEMKRQVFLFLQLRPDVVTMGCERGMVIVRVSCDDVTVAAAISSLQRNTLGENSQR